MIFLIIHNINNIYIHLLHINNFSYQIFKFNYSFITPQSFIIIS